MLPASAVPLSTRAVSLVTLSEFDAPLSLASARSIVGAPGFTVSVSTSSVSDAAEVLPARSVACEVSVCVPLASASVVAVQVPSAVAVTVFSSVVPSKTLTALPASALPLKVGVLSEVTLSVLDAPVSEPATRSIVGTAGTEASMVTESALEAAETLLAASVALAVKEWLPFVSPVLGVKVH